MYTTIGMAVESGRKAIREQLGSEASGLPRRSVRADKQTISARIEYGCKHAIKRGGLDGMTVSQRKGYEQNYKRGYMAAWSAGAAGKNVLGKSRKSGPTIASIGWHDGAVQGAVDVAAMSDY